MPNINLDDAYILDETGEQVDKVAGLFTKDEDTTSGEKAFAQLNIGTAGSNRNLLDNPWFTNPVNQRGAASLPASAYGIDRWKGGSTGSVSVTSSGLVFGSRGGNAWQPVESALRTWGSGKVFTASVRLSDGTVYSGSGTMGSGTTNFLSTPIELFMSSAGNFNIRASSAYTIVAVKLELGTVSTLANDAPPDYGEELAKCQYHFRRIKNTGGSNRWLLSGFMATASTGVFHLQNQMRDAGATISYSGTLLLNGGTVTSVTAYNDAGWTTIHVGTSASFTAFGGAGLVIGPGGYIDISRDI